MAFMVRGYGRWHAVGGGDGKGIQGGFHRMLHRVCLPDCLGVEGSWGRMTRYGVSARPARPGSVPLLFFTASLGGLRSTMSRSEQGSGGVGCVHHLGHYQTLLTDSVSAFGQLHRVTRQQTVRLRLIRDRAHLRAQWLVRVASCCMRTLPPAGRPIHLSISSSRKTKSPAEGASSSLRTRRPDRSAPKGCLPGPAST